MKLSRVNARKVGRRDTRTGSFRRLPSCRPIRRQARRLGRDPSAPLSERAARAPDVSYQVDAVIGTFTFDGAGGVTATRRLTWIGPIIITERQVGTGTYAVTPDGTATMTITWPETTWMPNSVWFNRRLPVENYELSLDARGFHFVVDVDHEQVEADGTVVATHPQTTSVGRAESGLPCDSAPSMPPGLGLGRRR